MSDAGDDDVAPACHRCGGRLFAGYLQSPRFLSWSSEPPPTLWVGGERLTSLWRAGSLPGYRCRRCREITVTYTD